MVEKRDPIAGGKRECRIGSFADVAVPLAETTLMRVSRLA
jgi:hypothetical protein